MSTTIHTLGVTFTFGQPVYEAFENEGQVELDIIKNGSNDYPRSITLTGMLPNGMVVTETLRFSPEETLKKVVVPLIDDEIALEPKEQYQMSLQVPPNQINVVLGQHPNTALEVLDNDGMSCCSLGPHMQKYGQILPLFVY